MLFLFYFLFDHKFCYKNSFFKLSSEAPLKNPAYELIEILLMCSNLSYSRLSECCHLFYFISDLSVCSGILKKRELN